MMVDRDGRRIELIHLDRGHGPRQWLRVSTRHGYLIGAGYYRRAEEALKFVDVESLVELVILPNSSVGA